MAIRYISYSIFIKYIFTVTFQKMKIWGNSLVLPEGYTTELLHYKWVKPMLQACTRCFFISILLAKQKYKWIQNIFTFTLWYYKVINYKTGLKFILVIGVIFILRYPIQFPNFYVILISQLIYLIVFISISQ